MLYSFFNYLYSGLFGNTYDVVNDDELNQFRKPDGYKNINTGQVVKNKK